MASRKESTPLLINDGPGPLSPLSEASAESQPTKHTKHNALGTINGCYVPCLLNIMGIIFFLRLPWATGQGGLKGILGGIFLAECMAVPTVLSLSAIVTNGNMRGGGAYYMISRSLGPELGGAIGILFYLAYAIGVAFYIIGFSTEVQTTFTPFAKCNCLYNNLTLPQYNNSCPVINVTWAGDPKGVMTNMCEQGNLYFGTEEWTVAAIGSVALLATLAISLKGAAFFAKFNIMFFVIHQGATLWGVISFLVPRDDLDPHGATFYLNQTDGKPNNGSVFLPPYNTDWGGDSFERMKQNWEPAWEISNQCLDTKTGEPTLCDFRLMFSVIFPMATGIMEGANLSGDLKNPAHSIPTGTLWALLHSCIVYVILVLCFAGAFERSVLLNDLNVFQNGSMLTTYVVIAGILISSFSAGLGSLFGGSRVLQAIARDDLYSILKPFKFGSKHGDEPRVAVMGTWMIAQGCVLIGNLDIVAPIITSIFSMSYAMVNLTVFVLASIGAPNFRPMFRYWSKWTALFGFIINTFVLFFLDYEHAAIGVAVLALLTVYLIFRGPAVEWGDISQELMFHQVRKYLLLIKSDADPKYWKPNLLLLVDDPNLGVLGFCNNIKKGGLLVTGHVIIGELAERFHSIQTLRTMWNTANRELGIKAFPHVTVAPTARLGYQFLMTCSGLGGLDVNTVVIPLLRGLSRSASGSSVNNLFSAANVSAGPGSLEASSSRGPCLEVRRANPNDRMADAGAGPDDDAKSMGGKSMGGKSMASNTTTGSNIIVPVKDAGTYCMVLHDALVAEKNLIITRNFGMKLSQNKSSWLGAPKTLGSVIANDPNKTNIDIWIVDDWGFDGMHDDMPHCDHSVMLLFQLGNILKHKQIKDKHKLRIMYVPANKSLRSSLTPPWNPMYTSTGNPGRDLKSALKKYCHRVRVRPDVVQVIDPRDMDTSEFGTASTLRRDLDIKTKGRMVNTIISKHSSDTTQLFITVPTPPIEEDLEKCGQYLAGLRVLSDGLPPAAMVINGQNITFVSAGM